MLRDNQLTTAIVADHAHTLQSQLLEGVGATSLGEAYLLNPLGDGLHARFLAFRSPRAQDWYAQLKAHNCITDVRGDVLRIGFGLYQDQSDVEHLLKLLASL
jgi:selenocysteine lyase/cysteine desulfurase